MSIERNKMYLCFLLLMLLSCNGKEGNIQGAWSLDSKAVEEPLPSKLQVMFSQDSPFRYEEEFYITDTLIEYPLGFSEEGNWPHRNFVSYHIKGDKMVIGRDTVGFEFTRGKLCIENQCFTRLGTSMDMRLQYVDLQVKYHRDLSMGLKVEESGEFDLYHSVLGESRKGAFSSDAKAYLAKLGSRLEVEKLNKIYNVGTSDVREYELFMVLNNESYAVKTFGLQGELPFEMRAFIHNLIKSVEEEVKKE